MQSRGSRMTSVSSASGSGVPGAAAVPPRVTRAVPCSRTKPSAVLDTGDEGGGVEMPGGIRPRLPGQLNHLQAVAGSGTRFETTQGDPGDPDGTRGGIRRRTVT